MDTSTKIGTQPTGTDVIKYWEDAAQSDLKCYGPVVFSTALLDQLLDLMGERHPIHDSDAFAQEMLRKRRIVPGGFIHSITSGWVVRHSSPAAIFGLRSITWDFIRPLYPDAPFHFTTEVESAEIVDKHIGLVKSVRRVFDESNQTLAIGRMNVVMQRRPVD